MNTWGFKWKGALFGAAALAAVVGPARIAGAAICGDLNGDGNRTIADAVRLQKAIFTPSPADCGGSGSASCGDVNPASPGLGVDDSVVLQASLNNKPTLFALCTGTGTKVCQPNAGTGAGRRELDEAHHGGGQHHEPTRSGRPAAASTLTASSSFSPASPSRSIPTRWWSARIRPAPVAAVRPTSRR